MLTIGIVGIVGISFISASLGVCLGFAIGAACMAASIADE